METNMLTLFLGIDIGTSTAMQLAQSPTSRRDIKVTPIEHLNACTLTICWKRPKRLNITGIRLDTEWDLVEALPLKEGEFKGRTFIFK